MTPREKILAACVAAVVALLGLWYFVGSYRAAFQSRNAGITALQTQVQQKENRVAAAKRATQWMAELEQRALPRQPGQPDFGRALYQKWLMAGLDAAGFQEQKITPQRTGSKAAYDTVGFSVSAQGNLDQVTRWLHGFYAAPYLHSVRTVRLTPTKNDGRLLEVALSVEAVSLAGTSGETLPALPPRKLAASEPDYRKVIVGRNLFGPPNAAPKFASLSPQKAIVGRPFSYTAKASDPDAKDQLTYALAPNAPGGASLDARTGEFKLPPQTSKETLRATLLVSDNGVPMKTDQAVLEITVVDPPPPPMPVAEAPRKPSFDNAKYTTITGILEVNGVWEVWLKVRVTDETLKLRTGDKIEVGSFKGQVQRIASPDVEFRCDGKRLVVSLGENLDQAQTLPADDI